MRKTKIVCTMGPNTDNKDIMEALVKNGMNVARFNFSHGDYEEQRNRMDLEKNRENRLLFFLTQKGRKFVPVF